MEIKTEAGTIDVELGKYVYDEGSDTWITWDLLDEPTKAHMTALVNDVTTATATIQAAIKNAVKIIGGVSAENHDTGYLA